MTKEELDWLEYKYNVLNPAMSELAARQEPLGQPYEKILHDNLWELMTDG